MVFMDRKVQVILEGSEKEKKKKHLKYGKEKHDVNPGVHIMNPVMSLLGWQKRWAVHTLLDQSF